MAVDVVLAYREHVLISALRDISLKGAFLETMPDELPYTNSHVELALTIEHNGKTRHCRIPARIARITDQGAGLSFGDMGMDFYSSLVSFVSRAG